MEHSKRLVQDWTIVVTADCQHNPSTIGPDAENKQEERQKNKLSRRNEENRRRRSAAKVTDNDMAITVSGVQWRWKVASGSGERQNANIKDPSMWQTGAEVAGRLVVTAGWRGW